VILGIGPAVSPWIWMLVALGGVKTDEVNEYVPAPTITSSPALAAITASLREQGFACVHSVPMAPGAA
jgi:hypothetical protein